METKETNKKNSSTIIIIILVILVICLGGYIGYNKLIKKESTTESNTVQKESDTNKNNETNESGDCEFTKFDSTYTLTKSDKEEIIDVILSNAGGLTREDFDVDKIELASVMADGYLLSISTNPKRGGLTMLIVAKIDGKFTEVFAGSGLTEEQYNGMNSTYSHICD